MLSLIRRHCEPGACPLVGFSVQCDREVLKVEMPSLYRHVNHQIVDISGFFEMARLWQPELLQAWKEKTSRYNHRAMNDAEESLEALRWLRDNLFLKSRGAASRQRRRAP